MNAPIKYFGGKGNMFKEIIKYFPDITSYDTYIEPFGGSFSIALKNPNIPKVEMYNDIEKNVYSLFKVLSDKTLFEKFRERCELSYYNEDLRREFNSLLKEELNVEDRAFYFFYVNRASFNGCGDFSINTCIRRNMSKSVSDFLSCVDRLPELHQRLSNVVVTNRDGVGMITKYNTSNVFIYADPPYEQSTRTGVRYKEDMDREKHIEFINAVNSSNAKILISGYDCQLYTDMLSSKFKKIDFQVNTIDTKHKPKTKVETLWKNYEES